MPIEFWRKIEKNDACKDEEKFLIQTCSQAKMSGTKLPEVYSVGKELNPNLRPEKQHITEKPGQHNQKRHYRKTTHRSGKSRIEKKAC